MFVIADGGVALRIERDRADGRPVTRRTGPARGVSLTGLDNSFDSAGRTLDADLEFAKLAPETRQSLRDARVDATVPVERKARSAA